MKKDMLEFCAWVIETAKENRADACKTNIYRNRQIDLEYRERKPEKLKEAITRSLSVEIFVDGRYSVNETSDLREEAVKTFISNSIASTRLLEEDPYRSLPDPTLFKGRTAPDLKLFDPGFNEVSPEQRHHIVTVVEDACLQTGGKRTISVTASLSDYLYEEAVMSSNGLMEQYNSTTRWVGAEMTAQGEADRRPSGYHYVGCRNRKALPDAKEIGTIAAERTLQLLGAKKIETKTLPIIIENRNVGRVLEGLITALYGYNIQQKRSFLANKAEKRIGSELFTIIDDPHIPSALGSRYYDGDGFATKKRTLIDAGVLENFLVDWYYSRKLGWEPTSGSTSNLIIPPGKRSIEQIKQDLNEGILITGFIGGNSNSTTGDFSVGIFGSYFKNGETVQPVAEMNIADNHLNFWGKLIEVANDPWEYSDWKTPSLTFSDIVVSGV